MEDCQARLEDLKRRIAEIRSRLPKHTPPPSMLIELDDLEEQMRQLLDRRSNARSDDNAGTRPS